MESKRIGYKNILRQDIHQSELYNKKDKDAISRLKNKNCNNREESQFVRNQIEKRKEIVAEREEKIKRLEKEIQAYDSGTKDEEILQEEKSNKTKAELQQKINRESKKPKHSDNKNSNSFKQPFQPRYSHSSSYRGGRVSQRTSDNAYNYMTKVNDSMPQHIRKKLENLPQNKGYIWRGVYYYGPLPCEKGRPTSLHEKTRERLLVHEWTDAEYRVFEKNGKYKKLISCKPRKLKNKIPTLMDYVKK